jgi:hypothetical protein
MCLDFASTAEIMPSQVKGVESIANKRVIPTPSVAAFTRLSAESEYHSSFLSLLRARFRRLVHESLEQVREFVESCKQQPCLHGCWSFIPEDHFPIGCSSDQELLYIRLEVDETVLQQMHREQGPRIQQEP